MDQTKTTSKYFQMVMLKVAQHQLAQINVIVLNGNKNSARITFPQFFYPTGRKIYLRLTH